MLHVIIPEHLGVVDLKAIVFRAEPTIGIAERMEEPRCETRGASAADEVLQKDLRIGDLAVIELRTEPAVHVPERLSQLKMYANVHVRDPLQLVPSLCTICYASGTPRKRADSKVLQIELAAGF